MDKPATGVLHKDKKLRMVVSVPVVKKIKKVTKKKQNNG